MPKRLKLQDMLEFAKFLLKFQNVVREVSILGRDHKENDVEHSYHLAMMGWYLNSAGAWGMETDKLIRYSLVHDLVEVHAGDVVFYDEAARKGKAARERAALKKIESDYPLAMSITKAIHGYEGRKDEESKFIYALDKLMPVLMIYIDGGRVWHEHGISIDLVEENKRPKIEHDKKMLALFDELVSELRQHPEYFPETHVSKK
jgi:putative hydrolase of HD superfamily